MTIHQRKQPSKSKQQDQRSRRRSIQSHLLWRSCLGSAAAWSGSGSNSRGVYLLDDDYSSTAVDDDNHQNGKSRIRDISSDKRMFHLPCSLRDAVLYNIANYPLDDNDNARLSRQHNNPTLHNHPYLQLLPQPRIIGATLSTSRRFSSTGISCMDLDRGYDPNSCTTTSPPRYLLVGSGGSDCTICLYDLSYFGSDECLNQSGKSQQLHDLHNDTEIHRLQTKSTIASVTHRPIARSLRHSNDTTITDTSGVPNGHRQPILNAKWYPADVHGSFVSASISGEILIWDAQQFVPVFATYTHVYSGLSSLRSTAAADGDLNKSVAPLKCMDLPKTPEGCPNGSALLALGLGGGDGRGVIQLCDAFRGGSATHELIGHTGGVNGLQWDPQHPFRLASAGEDCTVRLWDIRKAGASACLGVLDREKGMYGDTVSNKITLVQPSSKKRRMGVQQSYHINDLSNFQGVESHGVPVSSVAFTPSGDELVTAGIDGKIFHWDLRPDSCYDSPETALRSKLRQGTNLGMDPAVSTGGRLYPTVFTGQSRSSNSSKQSSRRRTNTVLAISQTGSRDTTTLFASTTSVNRDSKISGYSLKDGTEQFVLDGHLGDVTCVLPVSNWDNRRVGGCDDTKYDVKLLTGGKDGVVLSWGAPVCKRSDTGNVEDADGSGDDVISILRRQRQQRSRRTNCRAPDRDNDVMQSQAETVRDVDTW